MKNRTSLTKSLHTVTVVSRFAKMLCDLMLDKGVKLTDTEACRRALELLGWTDTDNWTRNDPTFAACVAKLKQIRESN